jgi:GYF domain 2
VTNGWHYAEGGKAVGPLDSKEMQVILSKISDPRNLQVWKVGFKGWERAGNVPELAEFIHEPPPLPHEPPPLPHEPPPLPQMTHRTSKGFGIVLLQSVSVWPLHWHILVLTPLSGRFLSPSRSIGQRGGGGNLRRGYAVTRTDRVHRVANPMNRQWQTPTM